MSFLNKKILDIVGTASGVDLSDLAVRVVQLEKNGKEDKVIGYGISSIRPGSILDGEIIDIDQVVLSIKKAFKNAGPRKIKSNKVICSLPETKAFLRIVFMPEMEEREIAEAIKWEIEANIPLSLEQVYYDWQILEKNISSEKNKTEVLVVAISKKTVEQFIDVLEKAGLDVVGLEIESIAQARSLLDEDRQDGAKMVVDLDEKNTVFMIANFGVPCFTSSIPVSAQSINDSISKALNISLEESERIKRDNGIGSDFKNSEIFYAVRPVLENLAVEIERSIEFFISELKYSNEIEEIIVCGREAATKGLIPYLAKRLGRKVILGDPWVNFSIGKKIPEIERNLSVEYATALGLALKGMDYENIS